MARRPRATAANGSVYLTSSRGVLKSTSASAGVGQAGMPRALDPTLTLTGSPGTLLTDTGSSPTAGANQARAYRLVWCRRDANNYLIQGAPSSRVYIVNTAGATRDVSILIPIPAEITTSDFVQVYASDINDFGDTIPPDDELRLVNEYYPTSTDITAGTCTIVDIVPDSLRGADLYTNESQSQGGIVNQNDRPPMCTDLVWFDNRLVGANLTETQKMTMQILGTSAMVTQTITIGGVTFTAGTAEATSTGTFQVFKPGGGGYTDKGTQALNVEFTAKSLVNVINRYAANTSFYAWYESGFDDAPGRILIEERGVGGAAFVAICSASAMGNSFSPAIPTSGTTFTSTADRRVNELCYSKSKQPEHMPRKNRITIGGADEEIQRILDADGVLIAIKDRSIWYLPSVGDGVTPIRIDTTCAIMGRDTAATLNRAVYMLSDQGFVTVTANGIQIVGRPVEDQILSGLEAVDAPDHDLFVGVANERERYYLCSFIDANVSSFGGQPTTQPTCYRYSPIANRGQGAWTKRVLSVNALAVNDSRLHYALNNDAGHILRQRSSRRDGEAWYKDYSEEGSPFVISSINTGTNEVTGTITLAVDYDNCGLTYVDPGEGWVFYQGSRQFLVLEQISSGGDAGTYVLRVNDVSGLTTGTVTILRPINWTVEYSPIAPSPLEDKHFDQVVFKLETSNAYGFELEQWNQTDTKSDPCGSAWTTGVGGTNLYLSGADSGDVASSNVTDFGNFPGAFAPYNEIRTMVHAQRSFGRHLILRLSAFSAGVANGFVAIKALVVMYRSTGSQESKR